MELLGLNTFLVILVYVPGYIFIQTNDHFLLKREKTQFEKTIQGLLASAVIFVIFILFKYQPFNSEKQAIINLLLLKLEDKKNQYVTHYLLTKVNYIGILFLLLCLYSFISACIFSIIRKSKIVSLIIQKFTNRDYFQNVELRFYSESINKVVVVTMNNNKAKYMGSLIGTPDQENDKKIIIYDPYIIEGGKLVKLQADRILVDTNNVELLEVIFQEEQKCPKKKRIRTLVTTVIHLMNHLVSH